MWMVGVQRGRLRDDLDGGPYFKTPFRPELLQLARDISRQYGASINAEELAAILAFVRERHAVSHANPTEANSIQEALDIVASEGPVHRAVAAGSAAVTEGDDEGSYRIQESGS